jgi:hypothetical protein
MGVGVLQVHQGHENAHTIKAKDNNCVIFFIILIMFNSLINLSNKSRYYKIDCYYHIINN